MEARSAQEIWEAALGELQIQVNKPYYQTWLKRTIGLSYQDIQFVVGVPNTFVAEHLDKNLRSLIEKTLLGLTCPNLRIHFHVNGRHQDSASSYSAREEIPPGGQPSPPRFNPKYTFDSFIVGSCNRLAHDAALRIARNPGQSYNPLFIYGGVGLGKTHLLHAIGNMALASNIHVLYVSTEQFTNEFINAVRERETEKFRNKYRSVDMLLIDDIHFISGKEQTKESFFHTFNELHDTNRQIAITSDRSPKSMPQLEERLRSRFEWGLITEVQPPDFETRLAVLGAKAEEKGVNITPDILEFIAQRVQQNMRELEGSLNRVIALARLKNAPPTHELAAQALKDIASKNPKSSSIAPSLVIEAVANSFQLTSSDLKSRKRDRETALARQVAMYLIRRGTNYPLAQIAKELGCRNPATVTHAYEKIAKDINISPYLRRKILDIEKRIYPERTD